MTERERLAELIRSAMIWGYDTPDAIAERLIDEGVICPPCKVGDVVYKIMDFEYTSGRVLEIEVLCTEIQGTMRFYAKTVKRYRYNYTWLDSADFGKTVFLTREEAEAALAERKKT